MEGPSSPVIRSAAEYIPVITSGEVDATPPLTFAQASDLVTPSTLPESDLMGEHRTTEDGFRFEYPTMADWTLPTSGPTRLQYSHIYGGRSVHMTDTSIPSVTIGGATYPPPTLPTATPVAPSQPSRVTSSQTEGTQAEDPMMEVLRRLAQAAQPPPQVAPPPPATDVLSQLLAALAPPPPPVTPPQPNLDQALSQLMEHIRRQAPPPPPPFPTSTPTDGLAQLLQALTGTQPRVASMPISVMNSKFCDWVARYPLPDKQKVPTIVGTYDGTRDPDDHLALFEQAIMTEKWVDPVACHMFPGTLQGFARDWFTSLPERSIRDFEDLKHKFIYHFFHQKKQKRTHLEAHLLRQKEGESIPDFIQRYTHECQKIHNLPESQQISGFIMSLLPGSLQEKLAKRVPTTFKEATDCAYDFLRSRETVALTRGITRNKAWTCLSSEGYREERRESRRDDRHPRREERNPRRYHPFDRSHADPPLTKTPREILKTEEVSNTFKAPPPMAPPKSGRRNTNKYCDFHEDNGHDTNACRELKAEIRRALEEGRLSHLVNGAKTQAASNPARKPYTWQNKGKDKVEHPGQPDGHILFIQDSHHHDL